MIKQMLKELEQESLEPEDDGPLEVDVEQVKKNLVNYASERLSDIVISYRYFGLNKELASSCMEELSRRRISGDDFNYEKYIEESLKGLPVLSSDIKNIDNLLSTVRGLKNAK